MNTYHFLVFGCLQRCICFLVVASRSSYPARPFSGGVSACAALLVVPTESNLLREHPDLGPSLVAGLRSSAGRFFLPGCFRLCLSSMEGTAATMVCWLNSCTLFCGKFSYSQGLSQVSLIEG